jgi:hypothetical protein
MAVILGTPGANTSSGGSTTAKKNYFYLSDKDSNIFRILPPFNELAEKNIWAQWTALHWGYGVMDENGNFRRRNFYCIREYDFKTKTLIRECPQCVKIAKETESRDALKLKMEREGKSPEEIQAALKPLSDWLKSYNLQKGFLMNVINQEGKIGLLMVPKKAFDSFKESRNAFKESTGIDVVAVNGAWVQFKKQKTGPNPVDWLHQASIMQESRGGGVMATKLHELTADVIDRLPSEAFDIRNVYHRLTSEQIQILVQSNGDPEVAKDVFSVSETKARAMSNGSPKLDTIVIQPGTVPVGTASETRAVEAAAKVAVAPPPAAPSPTIVEDEDEEALLLAKLAAARQKKSVPKAAPVAVPVTGDTMSNEDFLKQFGGK